MENRQVHKIGESSMTSYQVSRLENDFKNTLFFGSVNVSNPQDFDQLIIQIKDRARLENKTEIVGPIDGSTFHNYRLKLNFFEEENYTSEPANDQRLVSDFEKNSFEIKKKYFSHEFKLWQGRLVFWLGGFGLVARMYIFLLGYRMEPLHKKDLLKNSDSLHQIVDQIFQKNFLYSEVNSADFASIVKNKFYDTLDEKCSWLLFDKKKKCVGFTLCLKDGTDSKRVLFKAHGIEKQSRRKGMTSLAMMSKSWYSLQRNYENCLACLMIEGNRIDIQFRKLSHKHYDYGLFYAKI